MNSWKSSSIILTNETKTLIQAEKQARFSANSLTVFFEVINSKLIDFSNAIYKLLLLRKSLTTFRVGN